MPSAARQANATPPEEPDLLLSSRLPAWLIVTLRDNGFRLLSELSPLSDAEILSLRGVGKRSVELIRKELDRRERERPPTLH